MHTFPCGKITKDPSSGTGYSIGSLMLPSWMHQYWWDSSSPIGPIKRDIWETSDDPWCTKWPRGTCSIKYPSTKRSKRKRPPTFNWVEDIQSQMGPYMCHAPNVELTLKHSAQIVQWDMNVWWPCVWESAWCIIFVQRMFGTTRSRRIPKWSNSNRRPLKAPIEEWKKGLQVGVHLNS